MMSSFSTHCSKGTPDLLGIHPRTRSGKTRGHLRTAHKLIFIPNLGSLRAKQPKLLAQMTPVTIQADQLLLVLQQLARSSNSANFNKNINRIPKLPSAVKTTMPTFVGVSEKLELFEGLFQTSLKIHFKLTEVNKLNFFHSLLRGDALVTFKSIGSPSREILGEVLTLIGRQAVKPQSGAPMKHKLQRIDLNPANWKFIDFLNELQKLAKNAFGVAAQAIKEQFICANVPPSLKKSINQAHLENGTYG